MTKTEKVKKNSLERIRDQNQENYLIYDYYFFPSKQTIQLLTKISKNKIKR